MKKASLVLLVFLFAAKTDAQIISGGLSTIPTVLTDHIFTAKPASAASDSSLTPNLLIAQAYYETALANAITINAPINPSHAPQQILFSLTDNGTPRAITWDSHYTNGPTTTTTASTELLVLFQLESDGTHWKDIADTGSTAATPVTTTGTPSSPELTCFSATATITNCNISGDGTTTNTSALTVTKTNGVAFTNGATTITTSSTTTASASTITLVDATASFYNVTALAATLTITAPATCTNAASGVLPSQFTVRIKDNGGAQTLAYSGTFRDMADTRPTVTVAGKWMYLGFACNSSNTLDFIAYNIQP